MAVVDTQEAQRVSDAAILSYTFGWPTTYEIRVDLAVGESAIVVRRYTDFRTLREALLQQSETRTPLPELPPRSAPSMLSAAFREQRLEGLKHFLAEAMRRSNLESEPWREFLGIEADPAQAASEGAVALGIEADEEAQLAWALAESAKLAEDVALSEPAQPQPRSSQAVHSADGEPSTPSAPSAAAAPLEAHSSPPEGAPAVRSELDDIREMQRQRWQQQRRQVAASETETATREPAAGAGSAEHAGYSEVSVRTPLAGSAASGSPAAEGHPALSRLSLLPMQVLPREHDEDRLPLIKDALQRARHKGLLLEAGHIFEGIGGFRFCLIKCSPARGLLDASTVMFTSGAVLPSLERVQLTGLRQHGSGERPQTRPEDGQKQLFDDHVTPHFRAVFADPSRCGVVCLGDTPKMLGIHFEIAALEPEVRGCGIVTEKTQIFTNLHPLPEFSRIHVVPFSDTLPSAYDFNAFRDYVGPFFTNQRIDGFREGQTFVHNSVQFKVVATEPQATTCRVGVETQIFTEGQLHPSAANLLTPDQARRLAIYPPGLQMLLLHSNAFGNGEIAERIMEAENRRSQARNHTAALNNLTEELRWSPELASSQQTDQVECMVCLSELQEGDRVRILPCKHVFHTACIDEWLGRDGHCPLCRHALPLESSA